MLAEFQKATISFVMSVTMSVHPSTWNNSAPTGRISMKFDIWGFVQNLKRNLMFIGPCIIAIVDEWKTNLMSLAILFHLLCAQHVSDIYISIFRSLRLCWWITTSVVLFSVRCVLELLVRLVFGGVRLQAEAVLQSANEQRTENKTTDVVIHQHSRKLLKIDILISETCWAHNKWNKIASDIKLVFHSSTITMMHGPINIRLILPVGN